MRRTSPRVLMVASAAAAALTLSACSGGGTTDTAAGTGAGTEQEVGAVDLAAAGCPATVVIQTDWVPEMEHGPQYALLGDEYEIDAAGKAVTGPLMASGEYTGVDVEIRAGGPAISFGNVSSQMYQDTDITLGYVGTDEAIQQSGELSTTAVFATLDVSPFMIMWDPATYPEVTDLPSLSEALVENGGVVRYFSDSAYMVYLTDSGVIDESILDGSYDGSPANFVAAQGADAQQGFASSEPFAYENEVADWAKPVEYDLVSNYGWETYTSAMSVRTADLEPLSGCLEELVPVMQQAEVDYIADPSAVKSLVLELTEEYDLGFPYSDGVADYSVETMIADGIIGNGPNDTIGDFDEDRMDSFLAAAVPVYENLDVAPADGLAADDLFTNEFIDEAIGLP